jgi:hypothetical protein
MSIISVLGRSFAVGAAATASASLVVFPLAVEGSRIRPTWVGSTETCTSSPCSASSEMTVSSSSTVAAMTASSVT